MMIAGGLYCLSDISDISDGVHYIQLYSRTGGSCFETLGEGDVFMFLENVTFIDPSDICCMILTSSGLHVLRDPAAGLTGIAFTIVTISE